MAERGGDVGMRAWHRVVLRSAAFALALAPLWPTARASVDHHGWVVAA
jgi:hypothetical protein